MPKELEDFGRAIERVEACIHRRNRRWNLVDGVEVGMMVSVAVELNFLYILFAFDHNWSDADSSSMDLDLMSKIKGFKTYLEHSFIDISFARQLSEFLHVNEEIGALKAEIRAAYQAQSFQFHPPPPSSVTTYDWYDWNSLLIIINYLSSEKYKWGALERSLTYLRGILPISLENNDNDWSSWEKKMVAHVGGIFVQVAQLCCFWWYNPPLEQEEMPISLSDLLPKMDPTTPEFLDITLGFLGPYPSDDGEPEERSIPAFLNHVLGLEDETILFREFAFLLSYFIKIPEKHYLDEHIILIGVKDVVMEAMYLKGKNMRSHITHFGILFAKIWSLKVDSFIRDIKTPEELAPNHSRSSTPLPTVSMGDHVAGVQEGCKFLGKICSETKGLLEEKSVEYQMHKVIERVTNKVKSLYNVGRSTLKKEISRLHFQFLVEMMLLKAKALLLELFEKKNIAILHKELFYLIDVAVMATKEITEDEKLILPDFELLAAGVISLCDSFLSDNLTAVENMDASILYLSENIQQLMTKVRGIYFQIPTFNLPKTPGLCFIEFLLQKLRDCIYHKHDIQASAMNISEATCSDLEYIISARDVLEKQECKALHTRLIDLAYLAEYMLDLLFLGDEAYDDGMPLFLWLHHLSVEIEHIKLQLHDLDIHGDQHVPQSLRLMPIVSQVPSTTVEEVMMIGLNDQKGDVIVKLTGGTKKLAIVSIVGMPGIGKTTLATNVFCSPKVMYHFSVRAWSSVSSAYRKRDLLLHILSHIIAINDSTHAMDDYGLETLLYRQLKGKRYLIVMDDMWSTEPWDDLHKSFPDDSKGSRILVTSRLENKVSKPLGDAITLHELSDKESWELLKAKIGMQEEEYNYDQLLEVAQQIAKNCKGLPLAIGAIAGLLKRTNKNPPLWKEIAQSVSSIVVNDPEMRCKEIIELSYKHLSDQLKACFLYLGAFPEDQVFSVQKLLWLWIAEGFVLKSESKSVEDLAEDYLMDLVGRNLVIVDKRRSNGKVKACRVHDVIRDLCLLKVKEENFWQMITAKDNPYASFDDTEYDVYDELFNPSDYITYKDCRVCFYVNRGQFVASEPCGPFARSLLYIATTDTYPRCPYDVAFISKNFKRLGVLDLESINMGSSFGNGIEFLCRLRFLAVCGDMESIPPSLSKLENLETLVVKGLRKKVVLPDSIWRMKKLRHLMITKRVIFTLPKYKNGISSYRLDNLVSLSVPSFTCETAATDDDHGLITRFPNLRKLKCIVLGPRNSNVSDWESHRFPAFNSLRKLESLKVSYYGQVLINSAGELNFPRNIKELTLSNLRLPWSHISTVGRLKSLEVLKLISQAFEGSSWEMAEGEFANLKYLKLDTLDIVHWNASGDDLPPLEQLVVQNCKQLKGIPDDFVGISTLQVIEVQQCGVSVEESVGNFEEILEGIKIVINNSILS